MTLTKRFLSLASMALMTLAILVAIGPRSQAKAADCFNPYAVGRTESWHSIANLCNIPFAELRAANQTHIRWRDILYTGELLTLPGRDLKPANGLTAYTVVKGDSWYRIAQNHGLTFRDVRAFNPKLWKQRHRFIHPGDVMMLPLAGAAAAVAPVEPVVAEVVVEPVVAEVVVEPVVVAETQPAAVMDASGCPADLDFGASYSVGGLLQLDSPDPLDLYAAEGDRTTVVGQVAPGTVLQVLTNTSCIDGWLWWQVTDEPQGLTGWATAELTAIPVLNPAK